MREQGKCIIDFNTAYHLYVMQLAGEQTRELEDLRRKSRIKSQLMNLIRSVRTVMRGKK